MRNKWLLVSILLVGLVQTMHCQIENLDKLNGFKVFKFGDNPSKHANYIERDDLMTPPSKKVSIYGCDKNEYLSFGISFKTMELSFFENKLYQIMLWSSWEEVEWFAYKEMSNKTYFSVIADEAELIFGKMMGYTPDEGSPMTKGHVGMWETEKIRLDLVFMKFAGGKIAIQVKFIDKSLEKQVNLSKYQ